MRFKVQPLDEKRAYAVEAETTIQIGGEAVRAILARGFPSEKAAAAWAGKMNAEIQGNITDGPGPFVLAEMPPGRLIDESSGCPRHGGEPMPCAMCHGPTGYHSALTPEQMATVNAKGNEGRVFLIPTEVAGQVTKALSVAAGFALNKEGNKVHDLCIEAGNAFDDAVNENVGGVDVP